MVQINVYNNNNNKIPGTQSKSAGLTALLYNSPGTRTLLGGVVLVPGAAIYQLCVVGCTVNISSVKCKQQVQKNKKNTRILLGGVVLVPGAAIYQLFGGGVL